MRGEAAEYASAAANEATPGLKIPGVQRDFREEILLMVPCCDIPVKSRQRRSCRIVGTPQGVPAVPGQSIRPVGARRGNWNRCGETAFPAVRGRPEATFCKRLAG